MSATRKLLIMDDEPEIRDLVREIAEEAGYEVREVASEIEFKRELEEFQPDMIVLDVVMPDIDGITLIRYLAETMNQARVIIISGYGKDYVSNAQQIGIEYGLMDVQGLIKPFPLSALRSALK